MVAQEQQQPVITIPKKELAPIYPKNNAIDSVLSKRPVSEETEIDEEMDLTSLKRKRNTEAARRSRERKLLRLQTLEDQVRQLEMENTNLTMRLAVLQNEKTLWQTREQEFNNRIKILESQLSESHRAMISLTSTQI